MQPATKPGRCTDGAERGRGTVICETGKAQWERLAAAAASGSVAERHLPVVAANAALIAAAPELLEACQSAAPILDSFLNGQGAVTADEIGLALSAVAAAIIKATGQY